MPHKNRTLHDHARKLVTLKEATFVKIDTPVGQFVFDQYPDGTVVMLLPPGMELNKKLAQSDMIHFTRVKTEVV